MEKILDKKIVKKTRRQDYYEYLAKWKEIPDEDVTWMSAAEIQKHGKSVEDLMDRSPWNFCSLGVWCRAIDLVFLLTQ